MSGLSDIAMWFRYGGATMWAVSGQVCLGLLVGVVALVVVAVARKKPAMRTVGIVAGFLTIVCASAPVCSGVFGWWSGNRMVAAAVEHADPEHREVLSARGQEEARIPLLFGGGAGSLCLIAAISLLTIALGAKRPGEDSGY